MSVKLNVRFKRCLVSELRFSEEARPWGPVFHSWFPDEEDAITVEVEGATVRL